MTLSDWLLAAMTVAFAVDAWYTRKWLAHSKRELERIVRESEAMSAALAAERPR